MYTCVLRFFTYFLSNLLLLIIQVGFPGGSDNKDAAFNMGDWVNFLTKIKQIILPKDRLCYSNLTVFFRNNFMHFGVCVYIYIYIHTHIYTHIYIHTYIHRRRKLQPTPVFLPGKFHGHKSLAGYSPWGYKSQTLFRD